MSVQLKKIIVDSQAAFRASPEKAKVTFESSSVLQEGFQSEVTVRQHKWFVDEPPALGGSDSGPNPVELILAALGTCQEITYRAYATALGIDLESVSVKLVGELDLRGFFGVNDQVRPGYQRVTGVVHLTSSAPADVIQKLRDAVNAHCPVLDVLANKVPVELNVEHHNAGASNFESQAAQWAC
jgi:uncharacterized OsmC-like protein